MPFGSDSEGGEGGTADGALSTGSVAATGFTMGLGLGLSGRGMVGVDAVAVFTVFAILAVAAGFDAPFFAAGLDGFSDDLAFLGGRASSAESSPASAALRLRLGAFSLPAAFVRFAVRPSSSAASLALRLVLLEAGLLGAFCRAFCTSARSFRRVSEFFVDLPLPHPHHHCSHRSRSRATPSLSPNGMSSSAVPWAPLPRYPPRPTPMRNPLPSPDGPTSSALPWVLTSLPAPWAPSSLSRRSPPFRRTA